LCTHPLLCHPKACTLDFLLEMSLAVKNDADKKVKPSDQRGVLCQITLYPICSI
jgi:hypothetical protein